MSLYQIFVILSIFPAAMAAQNVKTLRLCDDGVATALISPKGTVLDFPANPEKVVLGTKNSFSIEYIRNDLAISPSTMNARSNLFVYLQGRRFSLDLATSPAGATLYFVRDCEAEKVTRKNHGR
jgi:hypothetical protein